MFGSADPGHIDSSDRPAA